MLQIRISGGVLSTFLKTKKRKVQKKGGATQM